MTITFDLKNWFEVAVYPLPKIFVQYEPDRTNGKSNMLNFSFAWPDMTLPLT